MKKMSCPPRVSRESHIMYLWTCALFKVLFSELDRSKNVDKRPNSNLGTMRIMHNSHEDTKQYIVKSAAGIGNPGAASKPEYDNAIVGHQSFLKAPFVQSSMRHLKKLLYT